MTVPSKFSGRYLPTKYFLSSYRALSDGRHAVHLLDEHVSSDSYFLSDWKIHWIAASTLLRSSIDLFREDAKSCLLPTLRDGFTKEFAAIKSDQNLHKIFWKFLKEERDAVIHHYNWRAYEAWIGEDGSEVEAKWTLISGRPENLRAAILVKSGTYKGSNSLDLLKEAADWVEARIIAALARGGFHLEEYRNLVTFSLRPPTSGSPTLLGSL